MMKRTLQAKADLVIVCLVLAIAGAMLIGATQPLPSDAPDEATNNLAQFVAWCESEGGTISNKFNDAEAYGAACEFVDEDQ